MLRDATVLLRPDMPAYPGEQGPTLRLVKSRDRGDEADVRELTMGLHTGTHVDAPCHFIDGGAGIDELPLGAMLGPCLVADVDAGPDVTAGDLERAVGRRPPERLLLRTRNSTARPAIWDRAGFDPSFAAIAHDGAAWLVDRGVRLVGIDYLSVEPYRAEEPETHRCLLGAGVVIVEGLDLRQVPPGEYDLLCLCARIDGADGAPARVILRSDD